MQCIPRQMNLVGHVIVKIRKCNSIFCSDWLTYNNLVDIIELIPVFIPVKQKQTFDGQLSFYMLILFNTAQKLLSSIFSHLSVDNCIMGYITVKWVHLLDIMLLYILYGSVFWLNYCRIVDWVVICCSRIAHTDVLKELLLLRHG